MYVGPGTVRNEGTVRLDQVYCTGVHTRVKRSRDRTVVYDVNGHKYNIDWGRSITDQGVDSEKYHVHHIGCYKYPENQ